MKRSLVIYLLVLGVFGLGIFITLDFGRGLPVPKAEGATPVAASPSAPVMPTTTEAVGLLSHLRQHLEDPLARLFLQLIVIVIATRAVGACFVRLGQPSVIGEMAAGILLGPSLLGWLAPETFQVIFPAASLGPLKLLSQIGVCLYMFVVGMELDLDHLRQRAHTAVVVSHAGILIPYFLGVVGSLALYSSYGAPGVAFIPFALFMGIAMSITAFPVLARILEERGLAGTTLGSTAITCAAVDDATAWSVLAVIVAIVHATGLASTVLCLTLVVGFVVFMVLVIRLQLPRWLRVDARDGGPPTKPAIAGVILLILASALTTEVIGIHALFGAFLAGVVMPAQRVFRQHLSLRIENFSSVFLLPLFFAFTGLRTQVGLLNDATSWLVCLGIIALATLGKLGGCMIIAKLSGMDWRESFSLGAMMNTRGLMELIALNIGYDFGILSPRIFTMMVLMALATTFMTGPLLNLAVPMQPRRKAPVSSAK